MKGINGIIVRGVFVILALASIVAFGACNAFKDYYDEGKEPDIPAPQEEIAEAPADLSESTVPDFASDTTPCEAIENITATMDRNQGIVANTGWTIRVENGETSTVNALQLSQFTTQVTISKSLEGSTIASIGLTIKQVAVSGFDVCDFSYVNGDETLNAENLDTGTIVIDKFNEPAEEGKVLNASYYNFSFAPAEGETDGDQLQGSYFVDVLSTPPAASRGR